MGQGVRKVLSILVVIGVVIGFKFYNKGKAQGDVQDQLVAVCGTDTACVEAVDAHFETCFEESYSMGGRRRSSTLNSDKLVACINGKTGVDYFSVSAE